MNDIEYRTPSDSKEFQEYDLFRWKILRKPIGKSIESLKDEYEDSSFHLIGVKNKKIVSCGRLHFNYLQIWELATNLPVHQYSGSYSLGS